MSTFLVCYDLENDRERQRVARILLRYGERVQYSVFEVQLADAGAIRRLCDELRAVAGNEAEIRFYLLTADGVRGSHRLDGSPLARRPVAIIL